MYKKINTKLGSRMILTDEQGRLTYEGAKDFMNAEANRGFSCSTVCDGPGVYRVIMSHLAVPYTVEEIGECESYTEGYSLAFVKAFKRLLEVELPLYCEEVPTDEDETVSVPASVESVLPEKEKAEPVVKIEPQVEAAKTVDTTVEDSKAEITEATELPAEEVEPVKEVVEEAPANENSEEYIQTLESTYITIGKDLKANPKTIKELCDEELIKPGLGMIGFIARKVKNNGNEENLRQADLVREYLALKNIAY